ncbi:MAG: metallophosphoesterase [Deltaproteobacteria bacterium]|nr:metallophosphoesterase [Deltaproteobacteria bacterium]
MLKILHTADWHVRDNNIEEIGECLSFLVYTTDNEKVDLVLIAGDIFDSRDIKLDSKSAKMVIRTISELADICPVAIVLGTASHDGTAAEVLRYARGKHFVHVSSVPEQIYLKQGELYPARGIESIKPAAVLTMIPQPSKQYFNQGSIQESNESISQAMNGLFAGFGAAAAECSCPHLLIYHGSISGARLSNSQTLTGMDIEVSTDQLGLSNADLFLCGHIHLPQELRGNVFYSGSIYPNNFGENHDHGFYIHEIE